MNRRTLTSYGFLPNYRNYWREAGYDQEMDAIEKAIAEGRNADVPSYFSDRWLEDNTLFGPAAKVRDGVAAWKAAGGEGSDPGAVLGRGQSAEGDRGSVRDLQLNQTARTARIASSTALATIRAGV